MAVVTKQNLLGLKKLRQEHVLGLSRVKRVSYWQETCHRPVLGIVCH